MSSDSAVPAPFVPAAVRLYERMGFRHLRGPLHPSKYGRANVFMELRLADS